MHALLQSVWATEVASISKRMIFFGNRLFNPSFLAYIPTTASCGFDFLDFFCIKSRDSGPVGMGLALLM